MSSIVLDCTARMNATLVPDLFLTDYMPKANGEFVKIYLYLLHQSGHPKGNLSLCTLADAFSLTENDVLRALRYWEKEGLLVLSMAKDVLTGIQLLPPPYSASQTPAPETSLKSSPGGISNTRAAALQKDNEEVQQLLFLAEKYLGRTLSPTDMNHILYFYDELHFPADLVEYLIEYCVSKGSTSMHYIDKVGLAWHQDHITNVAEAKARTNTWNKHYFTILKALGIRGHNPVPTQIEYMDRWINSYGFSIDLITEACTRTVSQTGQASFQYAESILSNWKKQHVTSMADVESLDNSHKAARKQPQEQTSEKPRSNRFNNFPQRKYDYNQLEQQLLNRQKNVSSKS